MPSKSFVVESVTVKATGIGKKTGKPWTLYSVRSNGAVFTTFKSAWQGWVGKEVTADYLVTEKGEFRLEDPPASVVPAQTSNGAVVSRTMDERYEILSKKTDLILELLREIRSKFV